METTIHVFRNKYWKPDNHLNYILWFRKSGGNLTWTTGTVDFILFENAEDQIAHVLQYQTPFVCENWFRLEVMVPNRDQYGCLQSGYIQDIGVLVATRELKEQSSRPPGGAHGALPQT